MVDSISASSTNDVSQIQQQQQMRKPPSPDDMFKKLSQDMGGDGKTITKVK